MSYDEEEELISWISKKQMDAKRNKNTRGVHDRLFAYFQAQEDAFGETLNRIRQMKKVVE